MKFFQLGLFTANMVSIILAGHSRDAAKKKLIVTVFSHPEGYEAAQAYMLRDNLVDQAKQLINFAVVVVLTHELNLTGTWTIGPVLPYLIDNLDKSEWYLFCQVNTVVRLNLLALCLNGFKSSEDIWLGHALYDHEPTIIHHFAEHTETFKYPNSASGFIISAPLLRQLAHRIIRGERPEGEFSIDAAYELATFIWDDGKGKRMIHVPELCVISGDDCATYPQQFHPCGESTPLTKIYVAIKTCSQFHMQRVPVIKKTWSKHAIEIGFYSDKSDEYLPEAIITPNTKQGHCAKTFAILEHAVQILVIKRLDWLVITDDDTILSLGRLMRLLTCYNPVNLVAMGERYGFRLWENNGYEYLTGGAGLVLSTNLVKKLVRPGFCNCPFPSAPDDMFLFGVCLKRADIQPTHSPYFHQARPADYPRAYLAAQEPVSFHKFWLVDPEEVYIEWFAKADSVLYQRIRHTDL